MSASPDPILDLLDAGAVRDAVARVREQPEEGEPRSRAIVAAWGRMGGGDPPAAAAELRLVDKPHPATLDAEALLAECEVGRGRSGGPGGQHRNKVETLVLLTHRPTGIEAHAGERRSVRDNTRVAVFRLRLALARGVRTGVATGDQRSELWLLF